MQLLTAYLRFHSFFTHSLQTAPLATANATLARFLRQRLDHNKFEESFAGYQSYLERVIHDNPGGDSQKLKMLDTCTRIYSIYRIPSKKLARLHNMLAEECLRIAQQEGPAALATLLPIIQRYNSKKAVAIFRSHKDSLIRQQRSLPLPALLSLIRFLKEGKMDETLLRETAIQMLYSQLQYLNEVQLVQICGYLALSRKYVNRDFLLRFTDRVTKLYRSGNLQDRHLLPLLSGLSEIQVNLHTRSIYVPELDSLYELAFPSLFASIRQLDDRLLSLLVSALRRSKYYDATMLDQLVEVATRREIKELSQDQNQSRTISLATFVNVVNTLAVFNCQVPEFKRYLLSILRLLSQHKQDLLPPHLFSRLVWSLCVLFERKQLADACPLIERALSRPDPLPLHDAMNFYLCYLYLRTAFSQVAQHRDRIQEWLAKAQLETHSSLAQREAWGLLVDLGVPCLMEYNLNNIICDIMVPQWKHLNNTVIEFHGFRHFCRNAKRLTGSSILKQKIIVGQGYGYYFIALDQWLLAEDKRQFLASFMEHIDEAEAAKSSQRSIIPARTSTRVRSRPKSFKI